MDEAKPMTSVFYDVVCLDAVRGGLHVSIEGHFWRFWGIWTSKCCRPSRGPRKRHFLTSRRVFWAIVRESPCTG